MHKHYSPDPRDVPPPWLDELTYQGKVYMFWRQIAAGAALEPQHLRRCANSLAWCWRPGGRPPSAEDIYVLLLPCASEANPAALARYCEQAVDKARAASAVGRGPR